MMCKEFKKSRFKEWHGNVQDKDGDNIDFSTAEKLYDYLVSRMEVDRNEIYQK